MRTAALMIYVITTIACSSKKPNMSNVYLDHMPVHTVEYEEHLVMQRIITTYCDADSSKEHQVYTNTDTTSISKHLLSQELSPYFKEMMANEQASFYFLLHFENGSFDSIGILRRQHWDSLLLKELIPPLQKIKTLEPKYYNQDLILNYKILFRD